MAQKLTIKKKKKTRKKEKSSWAHNLLRQPSNSYPFTLDGIWPPLSPKLFPIYLIHSHQLTDLKRLSQCRFCSIQMRPTVAQIPSMCPELVKWFPNLFFFLVIVPLLRMTFFCGGSEAAHVNPWSWNCPCLGCIFFHKLGCYCCYRF